MSSQPCSRELDALETACRKFRGAVNPECWKPQFVELLSEVPVYARAYINTLDSGGPASVRALVEFARAFHCLREIALVHGRCTPHMSAVDIAVSNLMAARYRDQEEPQPDSSITGPTEAKPPSADMRGSSSRRITDLFYAFVDVCANTSLCAPLMGCIYTAKADCVFDQWRDRDAWRAPHAFDALAEATGHLSCMMLRNKHAKLRDAGLAFLKAVEADLARAEPTVSDRLAAFDHACRQATDLRSIGAGYGAELRALLLVSAQQEALRTPSNSAPVAAMCQLLREALAELGCDCTSKAGEKLIEAVLKSTPLKTQTEI